MKRLSFLLLLPLLAAACTQDTGNEDIPVNRPVIQTSATLAPGNVNVAYSATLSANGGDAPYDYSLAPGNSLPAGLALSSIGTISGVPILDGDYNFFIVATDSSTPALTGSKQFHLVIDVEPLEITTNILPVAVAGSPYEATVASVGGELPVQFAWSAAATPPAWASISTLGVISGTPTASGPVTLTVQVTDSVSTADSAQLNLTVNAALAVDETALPDATVASTYNRQLVATGGVAPYTFAWKTGFVPPAWASLSASGVLSGSPSIHGDLELEISVTDSYTPQGGDEGTIALHVEPAPLTVQTDGLLVAVKGYSYEMEILAFGGIGPYTFAVTAGATGAGPWLLGATGISMNDDGELSGTYTGNGPNFIHDFTVQVTDSTTATASRLLHLNVILVPDFAVTQLPRATRGDVYGFTLSHNGPASIEPVTYSTLGGTLPSGIAMDATGSINGTTNEVGLDVVVFAFTLANTSAVITVSRSFDFVVYQDIPYTYVADANEPNNSAIASTELGTLTSAAPKIQGGPLSVDSYPTTSPPDPSDYFHVQTTGVGEIRIECFFDATTDDLDVVLYMYDAVNHVVIEVAYGGTGGDDEILVYRNAQPGHYYVQVIAPSEASFGIYSSNAYSMRISFSDLTITSSLIDVDLNATPSVDVQVVALNAGAAPTSPVWSLVSGSLPAGISFGADGRFTGTTSAYNLYNFTVQVVDGALYATAPIQVRFYNEAAGNFWLVKGERRDYAPPLDPVRETYAECMVVAPHPDYPAEGAIWVMGGREAATINEVAIFHTDRAGIPAAKHFKFEQINKPLITSRRYHGAVYVQHSYGGYIYVAGGEIGAAQGAHVTGDFWYGVERLKVADGAGVALAHPLAGSWELVANLPQVDGGRAIKGWAEFGIACKDAAADADDRIYIMGGRNQIETAAGSGSYAKSYHTQVLMYECPLDGVSSGVWHIKTDAGTYTGRRFPALAMIADRLFIAAGRSVAGNINTIEMYQPNPATTSPAIATGAAAQYPTLEVEVYFPMCAVIGGSMYIWAGWDNALAGTRHLHRFTPAGGGASGTITRLQDADWGTGFGPGVAHDGKLWIISGVGHGSAAQPKNLVYKP
ncbi:MAG: PPC domain-containing protein [Planctomycetes bacterium]|nr:PPC domain-containing protein [Planctomycetota bacterium]